MNECTFKTIYLIILFLIYFLLGFICAKKARGDTSFYVWNCGNNGETICVTNIEKNTPKVFGVAKITSESLAKTAKITKSDPPKKPYRFINWYMPPKFDVYPPYVRIVRERRQIGDINKPVYVVYNERDEEIAVSETGGRPLWVGVETEK